MITETKQKNQSVHSQEIRTGNYVYVTILKKKQPKKYSI